MLLIAMVLVRQRKQTTVAGKVPLLPSAHGTAASGDSLVAVMGTSEMQRGFAACGSNTWRAELEGADSTCTSEPQWRGGAHSIATSEGSRGRAEPEDGGHAGEEDGGYTTERAVLIVQQQQHANQNQPPKKGGRRAGFGFGFGRKQ